jgi:molecular chaperone DnaK
MFTTAVHNQRAMMIKVLQGEREMARDNWKLGEFEIEFAPAPKGVPRVGVQFEIDANGILHVLARDTKTGHQKVVEMKSAVDVDDTAVQQMVEESVEHAFEDLAARRWIEAKLKAGQLVAATRKGLADAVEEITPEYRDQVEEILRRVEQSLATENSETKIGDTKQLQSACAALDEATKPLAEILMDKAMEAMLIRKGLLK